MEEIKTMEQEQHLGFSLFQNQTLVLLYELEFLHALSSWA
jgi:hypothetical protein